ncbi:mif domain containing protein [Sporothrix schenckii 1099-18]|uniref:L-dopachrome isomerase n=1 Tax=Sporothrix schenckii 1099-18 TaxID=1397361 RepID=A0A0F2MGM4_SPOSC|nr:mif domain containing protein [Sporothrix schenckii 1099-18]KJR88853.1 mif domain containing protein [Sporothrix schenckii 1099-18]
MATATGIEQSLSLPTQAQTKIPAKTRTQGIKDQPQVQAHAQVPVQAPAKPQIQKRPIASTAMSAPAKDTRKPVNGAVKRDSGHCNGSNNSSISDGPESMTTHANHKHGSASSNGSSSIEEVNISGRGSRSTDLSFSQRAAQMSREPRPLLVKGDPNLLRDIDRPPPGDPATTTTGRRRSILGAPSTLGPNIADGHLGHLGHLARKRSQYFEDAFATRRDADNSPAKERVRSEALVLADVRTNVIVGDEFTIVTELSAHLALRYRRPLSSIVVTLQHGACMCFGGSFAPAYVMSVYGLPSQLQPTTNKRNAALIQRHMEETLGVPPARGHLRFVAVPEANLAYSGTTSLGHVDDLARAGAGASSGGGGGGGGRPLSSNGMYRSPVGSVTSPAAMAMTDGSLGRGLGSRKHKTARKLSVKSLSSFRSPSPSPPELTPPPSAVDEHPPAPQLPAIPERPVKDGDSGGKKNKARVSPGVQVVSGFKTPPTSPTATSASVNHQQNQRARRTKSFVATLFGRSTPKPEGNLS